MIRIRKSIKKFKKKKIEPVEDIVEEKKEVAEEESPAAQNENESNESPEEVKEEASPVAEEKAEEVEAVEEEVVEEEAPQIVSKKNESPSYRASPFKRIDTKILDELPQELKDNSFNAKFKYGRAGDLFGVEGNEKLRDKAGKGFRKEKSKLKNKNFQGGRLGKLLYNVNSTKI
jgi:hypothetical protein